MRNLILFVPPELAALLIAAAGFAMILGARTLAGTLFAFALALVFLPVLLAPLFDVLPAWLLMGMLVFFGFGLMRALFNLFIGRNSTDHMVGILAADAVRFALFAPSRFFAWVVRTFRG